MIERVVLFRPQKSRYRSLQYFTDSLAQAFLSEGYECLVTELSQGGFTHVRKEIRDFGPDLSISFNGVLPDPKRGALSEFLGLAHWAYLVDAPYSLLPIAESPYSLVSCVDETHLGIFEAAGFPRPLFLPHAVSPDCRQFSEEKRRYPIVFFGTCIDYRRIEERWRRDLPRDDYLHLLEKARQVLESPSLSCYDVMGHDINLWQELELYVRGKDRVTLLQSLKGLDVHVFGESRRDGEAKWSEFLDGGAYTIHKGVNYERSLEIMGQSEVVLNSVPVFKRGGHERIFSGWLMGCKVVSNRSLYTESLGTDICLYDFQDKQILDKISDFKPDIERASETVLQKHLWSHRIQAFVQKLPVLGLQIRERLEKTCQ